MRIGPGLAALGVMVAVPALARDGALSLGLTAPPTALLEPGMSLGWQETLGRRLILAVGLGVSEPHLGLFRATESVLRLRRQLEPDIRVDTRVAFDAEAGGYRVVLGPYDEARVTEQRARLSEQGFDSFLYRRN